MDFDVVCKYLRGPLTTEPSGQVSWAKVIVRGDKFYVAESRSRGKVVTSVTEYPMPDGVPDLNARRFGEWKWTQCGCAHSWGKHSIESLIAQARPIDDPSLVPEGAGLEVPAGEMSDRLTWIAETEDMEERKARAAAVYDHESDSGADLDGLDALLDAAVYADSQADPEPVEA